MNKLLLDTNVLIYAIDENSQFFSQARSLLNESDYQLFTTSKNLTEFLAVTTRGKVAPLPTIDALTIIEDFMSILTVLFANDQSLSTFRKLLSKYQPTGLKIHDFEIISIALAHKVSQVATFNTKDFKEATEIKLIEL